MEPPFDHECWICLSDDNDAPSRKWIRPCKCSLVAHERCLLIWIASKQEHTSEVRCPQCRDVYLVAETTSTLFQILDVGDVIVSTACRISYELAFAFATRVGFQAAKVILGPQLRFLLGGNSRDLWPHWAESGLRFLPVALITASLGTDLLHEPDILGDLFLFSFGAAALPMFILPTFRTKTSFPTYRSALPNTLRLFPGRGSWPPGPGLTLLMLPVLKHLYSRIRRRVFDATLGPLALPTRLPGIPETPVEHVGPLLGGLAVEVLAAFHPPPPPPLHPLDDPDPPLPLLLDVDDDPNQRDRFLLASSRDSAKRRVGAAVLMPWLAEFAATGLMRLSRYSGGLRMLLGVGMGSSVVVTRGGLGRVNVSFARDPVWWRATIGAFGILLVKDSLTLLHRSLKLKQSRTRRIVASDEL